MQRYLNIASWAVYSCGLTSADIVFLEDYSMGSRGRVFAIAENTAILKYLLHYNSIKCKTVPPTVIKKSFSGRGNATKEQMYDAFVQRTGFDLKMTVGAFGKLSNPVTDLVDSFAIGLYGCDYIWR